MACWSHSSVAFPPRSTSPRCHWPLWFLQALKQTNMNMSPVFDPLIHHNHFPTLSLLRLHHMTSWKLPFNCDPTWCWDSGLFLPVLFYKVHPHLWCYFTSCLSLVSDQPHAYLSPRVFPLSVISSSVFGRHVSSVFLQSYSVCFECLIFPYSIDISFSLKLAFCSTWLESACGSFLAQ